MRVLPGARLLCRYARWALIGVLLADGTVAAQSRGPIDPAEDFVDQLLSRYNGATPSPGCAVGVIRSGRLGFENGYGYADLEHDVRITPKTSFYLASLSKQFT